MVNANLVLIHGFWSSGRTWDRLGRRIEADIDLRGVRTHRFEYESPKLPRPFGRLRIPDYDDIAQTLAAYLDVRVSGDGNTVIVTHSQGGLILQRFLGWMLNQGHGKQLAHIRLVVMMACPNEGSDYLRSLRAAAGLGRHPQARELRTLNADAVDARRAVLSHVVHASGIGPHECRIPVHLYAGRSDRIVRRASAQSGFPHVGTLPGDHASILNPEAPNNITFPVLKQHILTILAEDGVSPAADAGTRTFAADPAAAPEGPATRSVPPAKYQVTIADSTGIQVGDHNTMQVRDGEPPSR